MFTFPIAHFGGAAAFTIDQSVRFNDNDSAQLSKTYSGAGNRRTASISMWIKRANISATMDVFGANSSNLDTIRFNSNDTMMIRVGNADSTTNRVFRDVGAWGHLFIVRDTTQSTSTNRLKAWWNNEALTFSSYNVPSQDADTEFMNAVIHRIGTEGGAGSQFFDGYLAQIHVIDGTAKSTTDFGEVSSATGQWIPKAYSGSYGTNGFRITGADSSDLGADVAGSNNFTSSGLAAADAVSDSPSSNHCTLNPLWVDGHTLSDGNLVASAAADSAAIGTMAFDVTDAAGFYFEAKVTTAATYPNVGIRTVESPSKVGAVANLSGNSTGRFAFTGSNGQFNDAGSGSSYGSAWAGTADKVIGVLVKAGALYFSIDGTIQNSGTAAKTGLTGLMLPTVFYDAGSGTAAAWEMRFDASDWSTTPSGYKAISSTSLADPSIPDASVYFQAATYAGNGSTQSITNGGNSDLQPDLVWIKNRSAADSHVLTDAVRGVTKILSTDSTGTESTDADTVTAFNSDGFALGDDDKVNTSSENYVAWQWKADSAWSEDATGNIVASSGRRNTTAGFSICSWTHQTSGNYAIKHGLSTTPEFFMTKSRDSGTNWDTWHTDLADTAKRILINGNGTEITAYWVNASDSADGSGSYGDISSGESPVTASLFGFQHDNFSGTDDVIGYFFHSVEGFSKVGSYVGNGNSAGTFVPLSFAPSFIIFKNISAAFNWDMRDLARDSLNPNTHYLSPSLNGAEVTSSDDVDFLSNGFKWRNSGASANGSGNTIVYAAWAESPFKTALAR